MGRMEALQPELRRRHQRQEACVSIFLPCYVHADTGAGPHGENGGVAAEAVAVAPKTGSAHAQHPRLTEKVRQCLRFC
jgi:hypothetical protein